MVTRYPLTFPYEPLLYRLFPSQDLVTWGGNLASKNQEIKAGKYYPLFRFWIWYIQIYGRTWAEKQTAIE